MRSTMAITRGPEMIHLGFSTITAIGLVLLTTACGDKTDEGGKLFDVVSAAEIAPPVAPATLDHPGSLRKRHLRRSRVGVRGEAVRRGH
jgi:hypothetical protein